MKKKKENKVIRLSLTSEVSSDYVAPWGPPVSGIVIHSKDEDMKKKEQKICRRCGRPFINSVPKRRNNTTIKPELLYTEIATELYCANCNRVVVSAVYRNNSAYFDPTLPFGGLSPSTQRSTEEG